MESNFEKERREIQEKEARFVRRLVMVIAVIIILAISVGVMFSSWKTIPAGTKGVVTEWGRVVGMRSNEGFVMPISQGVILMPIGTNKVFVYEEVATNEQQAIMANVSVNYKLNAAYVDDIYVELHKDYEGIVIIPAIRDALKTITPDYTIDEFTERRAEIKIRIDTLLDKRLDKYHIIVESVNIENWEFPADVDASISKKQIARQEALEEEYKLEKIRIQAQQQIIEAEAGKNATIINSEAEAQKQRIAADADAYAVRVAAEAEANATLMIKEAEATGINMIVDAMTNDDYIRYIWANQWSGDYPTIMGGDVYSIVPIDILGETNSTSTVIIPTETTNSTTTEP